jgi:hypothetical protein
MRRKVVDTDRAALAENEGMFDDVLKLANIAGVIVLDQKR